MSKIEESVNALESKIKKILHNQEVLKQTNAKLSKIIEGQQEQILQYQEDISAWSEKYETLKIANSMLGSDDNKRDTKLKINTLIRDIDHCIAQLAE